MSPASSTGQAYLRLKQDILSGVYSSNERLVEAPLTSALGISRNTLRAVMARLEYEGLVVLEPNRGGRVRSFSLEEARDVLTVREVLEGLVARLAAVRASAEQRVSLRATHTAAEQALAADDLLRFSGLNRQFHLQLVAAADSPRTGAFLDALHFPLVKFRFPAVLVPGRTRRTMREHDDVLRAIEAGDAPAAEQAARRHIQQLQDTLTRWPPPASASAPA
jgi:DNA-binding GntR family transcriptional regulator